MVAEQTDKLPDQPGCPRPIDIIVVYQYEACAILDPYTNEIMPCGNPRFDGLGNQLDYNDPWYVPPPSASLTLQSLFLFFSPFSSFFASFSSPAPLSFSVLRQLCGQEDIKVARGSRLISPDA
jgi:hypothetical protein